MSAGQTRPNPTKKRSLFGLDHIAFEVEADEDLWVLKQALEAADILVSEVIDHGFFYDKLLPDNGCRPGNRTSVLSP